MQISGPVIPTFTANIKHDFKPKTSLALSWGMLSSGNMYSVDREAEEDVYESAISLYGEESSINNFVDQVEANRVAGINVLTWTPQNTSEERIFGANVNGSGSYSVTVEMDFRRQGSFKGFGVPLKVRNLSPSFTGTATLPVLKPEIGYSADSSYSIYKTSSYTGAFSYIDRESDVGFFEGVFNMKFADMQNAREFIRTTRGSTFSLASSVLTGVSNPFGRRSTSFPYNVKIVEWEDLGPNSSSEWWGLKIKFAEIV